jgi:spore germination protein GerM
LTALIAGPTSAEASQGITSALPTDLKVTSIALVGSTVTLNFNTAFGKINGSAETQAVGQVVLTTTDQPQISAVSFQIDSKPISVPTSSGVVTSAPVTAAQYAPLKN